MFYIGCHMTTTKGYRRMVEDVYKIGGNTCAFFTRNPRGGSAKAIDEADMLACQEFMKEKNFGKLVAHAPYTMNCCSKEEKTRIFARQALREDLERMEYLPNHYYNFHPGSHVGQGEEVGIELIVQALNESLWDSQQTIVLLETMAGKGSEVGKTFEEIKAIIDGVILKDKMGVCLDTCHISDGGYDVIHHFDKVLDEFDKVIGIDRLKAIHFNDSKNEPGSRKDRHERIGEGKLGLETLLGVIREPRLDNLPFILETPNEMDGYEKEIRLLKSYR